MRYVPEFGFRTKIEVPVPDAKARAIIDDVLKIINTGSASDGKIFCTMSQKLTTSEASKKTTRPFRRKSYNVAGVSILS